jgi:hypothetical protein
LAGERCLYQGSVYQQKASALRIPSTVYAIEKWIKHIRGGSRASDLIGGTMLALLLPEVKLRTVFRFAATLNELLMASGSPPQSKINSSSAIARR